MATEVRIPSLGQSATEATILAWLVSPGANVAAGDPLMLIETDKAEQEVEAPTAGTVGRLRAEIGATLPIGALATVLLAPGEAELDLTRAPSPTTQASVHRSTRPARSQGVSPKARRLAAERGVPLEGLNGTGPDGLIVAADVPTGHATVSDTWRGRPVIARGRLGSRDAAMARRLAESWQAAPHFVQMVDVDLLRLRDLRASWRTKGGDLARVTWTDVVVAATARALAEQPELNVAFEAGEVLRFTDVNIGVAVDTSDGLVVPVVAGADRLTLPALSARIRSLAATGRGDDVAASATVSNLGAWGIRAGTPVLNPPEPLLVFVGAVEDRVVARDGAVVIRPMSTLSVAFDHRVVTGARGAGFVAAVRARLEDPDRFL